MTTNFKVIHISSDNLNTLFWTKYKKLWENSNSCSAFYCPSFLNELILDQKIDTHVYVAENNDGLFIAALLLKHDNKRYEFISVGHSDHNPLIFRTGFDDFENKVTFLSVALKQINGRLFLKNVFYWNNDLDAIVAACKIAKKKAIAFPAWKCPITIMPKGESPKEFFMSIFKKRRLNTYYNKIKRTESFSFEIQTGEEEIGNLREWIEEFCFNHELRWNDTLTPSQYTQKSCRTTLLKKVIGWQKDNVGIRFTISAMGRRLAMVICLKEKNRLIYCLPSYAPDQGHTHAGSILLSQVGIWAGQNGYSTFDFGNGTEDYKLRFANKTLDLYRIYIYNHYFSAFMVKGWLDNLIRINKFAYNLWSKFVLDFYRGKFKKFLNYLETKIKNQKAIFLDNKPLFFTKLIQWWSPKREIFFYAPGLKSNSTHKKRPHLFRQLAVYEVLDFLSDEVSLTPDSRLKYIIDIIQKKRIPFGLFDEGRLVQISWVKVASEKEIPPFLLMKKKEIENWHIIMDCFTSKANRRKGYYFEMLKELRSNSEPEPEKSGFLIYADSWNKPSQKGIMKAGFKKIAERKTTKDSLKWKEI